MEWSPGLLPPLCASSLLPERKPLFTVDALIYFPTATSIAAMRRAVSVKCCTSSGRSGLPRTPRSL